MCFVYRVLWWWKQKQGAKHCVVEAKPIPASKEKMKHPYWLEKKKKQNIGGGNLGSKGSRGRGMPPLFLYLAWTTGQRWNRQILRVWQLIGISALCTKEFCMSFQYHNCFDLMLAWLINCKIGCLDCYPLRLLTDIMELLHSTFPWQYENCQN